jgi:hypothetical protein
MSSRITAHLRRRPSAGLVLGAAGLLTGIAALVVALGGIATGLPGRFRVDRNDLRRRVVRPINVRRNAIGPFQLAPGAVRRWHIAPDSVTGAQVDESSLGTVPSAEDADTLDGQDAGDFAPAGAVYNSGRVGMNDDTAGDSSYTTMVLRDVAPFTITLGCLDDNTGGYYGYVHVSSDPHFSSFAPGSGAAGFPNAVGTNVVENGSVGDDLEGGQMIVVSPTGEVMNISASVETGDFVGEDCIFGVTTIGP